MQRPKVFLTKPISTVGIDARIRIVPIKICAPKLSQRGPRVNCMIIVPAAVQMFDVQMSFFSISRDFFTSGRRGTNANQMKKAMKK